MSGPSFNVESIAGLASDTGVETIADRYNRAQLWYAPIVRSIPVAAISHPPLVHRSRSIIGGANPRRREDGETIRSSALAGGYIVQAAARLYSDSFSYPERQIAAIAGNPKAMVNLFSEWQASFIRNFTNVKNDDVAKKLVNGGKTAGDAALYDDGTSDHPATYPGLGYDGVCWFSAAHPLKESAGTTKSNTLGASGVTFNDTNVDAARVRLTTTNAVDETNKRIIVTPRFIVGPQALSGTMARVLNANTLAGTANGDANYVSAERLGVQQLNSAFLDTYSSTAWFMVGDVGGLVEIDGGPPNFRMWWDEQTRSMCMSGEGTYGSSLFDFRDLVGANLATS